jgi:type I restriction enzyme M protein
MSELSTLDRPAASAASLPDAFRRIYFHLYSNSTASRAERILENISLLLLARLAAEQNGGAGALRRFMDGETDANESLLGLVRTEYPELLADGDAFSIDDAALRAALAELEDQHIGEAPAHVLGEAFEALMAPRLRGDRGQFFTPRSLVSAMVAIVDPRAGELILDPACGTGGFLAEAFAHLSARSGTPKAGQLLGIDKDHDLARLAAALLTIAAGEAAKVSNTSSLTAEMLAQVEGRFHVVLTNPPFGAKIGVTDAAVLELFDFGREWVRAKDGWRRTDELLDSQDPQALFLELCVLALKPGGRMGIVLPEGMFGNRKAGFLWHWLRARGEITALIDCPRTTFQPGTDTKTNVLFFRRHRRRTPAPTGPARLGVALQCGHDRRGRSHVNGAPIADDFAALAADYAADRRGLWRRVPLQGEYLVPRYHSGKHRRVTGEPIVATAAWTTLGELVQGGWLELRKGHEVGSDAYGTGDVPFVRTSDIANLEVNTDPTNAVSEDVYRRYAPQQALAPGDILMVADGRYRIGAVAMLDEDSTRCVVQSHLLILSSASASLDPVALIFALVRPAVRMRIRDLVFVQSTLGTLGPRALEIPVPLLVGDGPWTQALERFRSALIGRHRLRAELRAMASAECEL